MDRRVSTRRPPTRNPSLDHPDLQALREQDAADDERFDPFGEAMKKRWKLYVVGAVIFFPLVTALLTPAGFSALYFQIPIAAAYGTYLAYARPTGVMAALATLAAGLLSLLATGHLHLDFSIVVAMIAYAFVGYVIGISEYSKLIR